MKKVVLITGGGRGIGFGIAEAFLDAGYSIAITGRTEKTLEEAKRRLEEEQGEVLALIADGTKEEEVQLAVEQVVKHFGRLDCLVNNAQSSKSGLSLVEHSKDDFLLAIESGLVATFYYMKYAYPFLVKSRGTVINFASAAAFSGKMGQSSYAASKEGIRGLSRVAANEWASSQVTVNVVCPLVETEGLAKWKETYPDLYKETLKDIPLGRFGDAKKDVGSLCVFLASEGARYITGETIGVQGGVGLRP